MSPEAKREITELLDKLLVSAESNVIKFGAAQQATPSTTLAGQLLYSKHHRGTLRWVRAIVAQKKTKGD